MQDKSTTVANERAALADDQSGTAPLDLAGKGFNFGRFAETCDHMTGEGVATLRSRCA